MNHTFKYFYDCDFSISARYLISTTENETIKHVKNHMLSRSGFLSMKHFKATMNAYFILVLFFAENTVSISCYTLRAFFSI